jgi:hypothetical protein
MMDWLTCATWGALVLFFVCVFIVAYFEIRDRRNRGIRIDNGKLYREKITRTLPDDWMKSFHARDYRDDTE